jgi:hypothetical protein
MSQDIVVQCFICLALIFLLIWIAAMYYCYRGLEKIEIGADKNMGCASAAACLLGLAVIVLFVGGRVSLLRWIECLAWPVVVAVTVMGLQFTIPYHTRWRGERKGDSGFVTEEGRVLQARVQLDKMMKLRWAVQGQGISVLTWGADLRVRGYGEKLAVLRMVVKHILTEVDLMQSEVGHIQREVFAIRDGLEYWERFKGAINTGVLQSSATELNQILSGTSTTTPVPTPPAGTPEPTPVPIVAPPSSSTSQSPLSALGSAREGERSE